MPVMDGHEAIRRIKATAQGQATVVIAVTAGAFDEQRTQILADGCDDFAAKPFHQEEIVQCLVKHLGVRMVYTVDAPVAHAAAAYTSPQQAATAADAAQLRQLAAAVAGDQPALAAAPQASVDVFDYGARLGRALLAARANRGRNCSRRHAPHDLKVTVTPLRNRRGKRTGRLAAMHDITARRHAEEALRRQNEYLQALQQTERAALYSWIDAYDYDAILYALEESK